MEHSGVISHRTARPGSLTPSRACDAPVQAAFREQFAALFTTEFPRLYRYLDRLSGEPELAADLAQEAFVRLYRRHAMPDEPPAWLVTVALNLFRNTQASRRRQLRLLTQARGAAVHSDPLPSPAEVHAAREAQRRVRAAVDRLSERDRRLLLLHTAGYRYREIAAALDLNETSVGTLLARARQAFREVYEDDPDPS